MANPPPLWPAWNDSQTDLLRKILTNIAFSIENGGGGGGSLPAQGGHAGQFLTTNGVAASWAAVSAGAANAYAAPTNNAGNTTLTPTQSNQTYLLTVGGSARSSIIILATAGRTAGDRIMLDLALPAAAAIVLDVRNATAGGARLLPVEVFPTQDITTDGSLRSTRLEFTYTGAAWIYDMANLPA